MCVLPDVGHQCVPVEFRLGVVGRGRWIQRVISLCTNTDTQERKVKECQRGKTKVERGRQQTHLLLCDPGIHGRDPASREAALKVPPLVCLDRTHLRRRGTEECVVTDMRRWMKC